MKRALCVVVLVFLFAVNFLSAQELDVAQATDGNGWSFVLVITNTTTSDQVVSITFYQDNPSSPGETEPWNPPFVESDNPSALTVPAGSTRFLHSTGTAAALTQGWARIIGSGVQAYIVYTHASGQSSQEATAPGLTASAGALVPFEDTGTFGTGVAIVNPNAAAETALLIVKAGSSVTQANLDIPANGHITAFIGNTASGSDPRFSAAAGQSGLMEIYVASGKLAVIALRSDTSTTGAFAFTTAPTYGESSQTISTAGAGGGGGGGGGIPSGDITFAGFSIGQNTTISGTGTTVTDTAGGVFAAYTPTAFNAPYSNTTKIGSCTVYAVNYSLTGTYPASPSLFLNAGNSLSLSGPSLPAADQTIPMMSTPAGPAYILSQVPSGTFQDGGIYTLSGTGGTQVKAFKVSTTLPANFSTNLATITAINRSQPLTVTWTGTGFEGVIISVGSLVFNTTTIDQVVITCLEPASAGTFTVPTAALAKLSATTPPLGTGTLSLTTTTSSTASISSQSALVTSFTPNLVSGGKMNYGAFAGFDSVNTSVSIQ